MVKRKSTIEGLIGEELKDEIYRITEIVINEKIEEFDKRLRDLEIVKAEIVEVQNELKHEIEKLRRNVKEDKKNILSKLNEINKGLSEIFGKLKAIEERLINKKRK